MRYFANPTKECLPLMQAGVIGYMEVPGQARYRKQCPEAIWCADNGCFSEKRFKEDRWFKWLSTREHVGRCAFATAPDVYGDAVATLERSTPWLPKIRALGYPAAYVAQDGQEHIAPPWDAFDVLFIGGTDVFKLGPVARQLVTEAHQHGHPVHMGRVNSQKRYRYADAIGCDSADGTFLTFAPSENLAYVLDWLRDLEDRPALFRLVGDSA